MFKWVRTTYDWMGRKVNAPYADAWLGFLFFLEAFCFIIPIDPLLIVYCIHNKHKSLYYATISTVSSVAGGVVGYFIGYFLWDSVGAKLVYWVISPATFEGARQKYELYQHWAVLIGGISPFPYKAVTLSAGFCKLSLGPFIIFSFIARGLRFYLIAGAIKAWGSQIKFFIDRYFNQLVVLFVSMVMLFVWLLKLA